LSARIGIGQRDLLVLGLHHLSIQLVQALYLLTQRRNLLFEPGDLSLWYRFPLAIGAVELREIRNGAQAFLGDVVDDVEDPRASPTRAPCASSLNQAGLVGVWAVQGLFMLN
jgi:hypothetical protein